MISIMFRVSSGFEFQDITNLLQNSGHLILGKLAYDENIPCQVLLQNRMKQLEELMRKDILCLALRNANRTVNGVVLVERAEWDSEHFDVNVGKLKLALFNRGVNIKGRRFLFKKVKDAAASHDLSVIFSRIALNDLPTIQSLENEGAILTDILLTFYINLERKLEPVRSTSVAEVAEANERDEQVLMEIAKKDFLAVDHFHADPYLPRSKSDEVNPKWVSSCLKGLVDEVLVARKGGKPIGFVTCNVEHVINGYTYGFIDLAAVKKEHEGGGIGSLLFSKALRWLSDSTKSVYTGTQAVNVPAVRLFRKAGFRQVLSEATLHLWIS